LPDLFQSFRNDAARRLVDARIRAAQGLELFPFRVGDGGHVFSRGIDLGHVKLTVDEARRFLAAAKATAPRVSAFYALAVDSGMRIGELCGVMWGDIDFEGAKVTVMRQLIAAKLKADGSVHFDPPKTAKSRTIDLGAETITLLRVHRQHQSKLKMPNRTRYCDLGLVFAQDHHELFHPGDALGPPLQRKNMGAGEFARVRKAAQGGARSPHHDARAVSHVGDAAAARGREREGSERAVGAQQSQRHARHLLAPAAVDGAGRGGPLGRAAARVTC
jgi:integrase